MIYQDVLAHLEALQMHKIKLGLEAMQSFLEKVGRPESRIKFVHLAGTNGKGSVCAALSEILGRAGYRVGVYTSPHLSSVRERFRIDSDYISEAKFAELGTKICEVLGEDQITYFEFTTALGLLWFAESNVDLVLLETGMGGRLDATNVVTPLVSVITSISMDHEAYLGDTLPEIAGEKAGIIKAGIPVVSAAIHPEAAAVVTQVCQEEKSPLYILGQDFDYNKKGRNTWGWQGPGLPGDLSINGLRSKSPSLVQQENQSLAIAVLQLLGDFGFTVTEDDICQGIADVSWPGRMEYFELDYKLNPSGNPKRLRYLLDGAHNSAGVKNLAETLALTYSRENIVGIWGSMIDKDLTGTLQTILPHFSEVILTQPEGERSARPGQIFELLDIQQQQKTDCIAEVSDALAAAQKRAGEDDLIVVGGSLYLIGAIRFLLLGDLA